MIALQFQPFLRFYDYIVAKLTADKWLLMFQPFLRFYEEYVKYAELKIKAKFQPFLRFYLFRLL